MASIATIGVYGFDREGFLAALAGARTERDPEACHRSPVAARPRERFGFEVTHLRPPPPAARPPA